MQPDPAAAPPNSPGAVAAIANMIDPVLRNCCITDGYYELSRVFAARSPGWTNWLMFAVWASKQAGRTIRGEDLTAELHRRLRIESRWLAPVESAWRVLLRRGLLNPATRLGRLVRAIPGPLDAIERASDALAKGNQLIFGEIAVEFARMWRPGIWTSFLPASGMAIVRISGARLNTMRWLRGNRMRTGGRNCSPWQIWRSPGTSRCGRNPW